MLNLSWLIPVIPLLAFAIIILVTNRGERRATARAKQLSSTVAIVAMAITWLFSLIVVSIPVLANYHEFAEHPFDVTYLFIPTGEQTFGYFGILIDPLTAAMLLMVPFVCLMIFIYARGYMSWPHHLNADSEYPRQDETSKELDPRYSRFFAYVSLFAAGMLGVVLANNLFMLFVFWEIMGLCSYLLISFWFEKKYWDPKQITPKGAGLKAFLTTRIGDVIMFSGMALLFVATGTLNFDEIFRNSETMHQLADTVIPALGISYAALIAFLIFWGSIGKSAQFPLHVWLPDAMEGPTPVSALIHAATMVSAGVYLVIRMFPLFEVAAETAPWVLQFVAFIGAFTAIFAATIAVAQNDIKRVLAYSTISQLGYMFAALGIGAYVAATFHLLTHAFFKALLFLGSGAVIHAVEHGEHELHHAHGAAGHGEHDAHGHDEHGHDHDTASGPPFDPQDMMNMGGLWRRIPRVGWTFVIGGLALAGFPLLSAGFWSKDEILSSAWTLNKTVFWTLAVAALITAFYTGRQIFLTFGGEPRSEAAALASIPKKLPRSGLRMFGLMTWPLVILSIFALVGGFIGIPEDFPVFGAVGNYFEHWIGSLEEALLGKVFVPEFTWFVLGVSIFVSLGGLGLGWLVYGRKPLVAGQVDPVKRALGPIWTVLNRKYYFDELYSAVFIRPAVAIATYLGRFDRSVIDGIVNGVGRLWRWIANALRSFFDEPIIDGIVNGVGTVTGWFASIVRRIQTGQGQNYLLFAVLTILLVLGFFLYT